MNATNSSLSLVIAEHGLSFAVANAEPFNALPCREYAASVFGMADKAITPTSESHLWGLCISDLHDESQDIQNAVIWWANIYSEAIEAWDAEDHDRYHAIVENVQDGNGDYYQ